MYYLFGSKDIVETLIILSRCKSPNSSPFQSRSELKKSYQNFITSFQSEISASSFEVTELVSGAKECSDLSELFRDTSAANDLSQETVISRNLVNNHWAIEMEVRLIEALDFLKESNPEFYELFTLAVNRIFISNSGRAGGGSTSGAIGVIWANPRTNWSTQDLLEFFIHEATHQFVFLDEFRHRHYSDYEQITKPINFSMSSILKIPRPLDKVLHSLLVSVEVLHFREYCLGHPLNPKLHPPTPLWIDQIQKTLESLKSMPQINELLTVRGHELVKNAELKLEEIRSRLENRKVS